MGAFTGRKGILLVCILVLGTLAVVLAVQNSTNYQQHASKYNDLNKASEITSTINADGTMGPYTWEGNFSNTLPASYLGSLDFQVTDPEQGHRPTDIPPTRSIPTEAVGHMPSISAGSSGTTTTNGPQQVKSLILTVRKVEVHLARLAAPGERITPPVSPADLYHGRPTASPTKTNQNLSKWETLDIGGTQTVDLVQLANTKNFATLGLTKLAGGLYTEVRLYIEKATATLANGTTITLTIPGRANTVRVVEPFEIVSGKTTNLSMDFDAQNSVIKTGDLYLLKPVVAHFNQTNQ